MKATPEQLQNDFTKDQSAYKAVLLFGPNSYLVKKLRAALLQRLVPSKEDLALRVITLESAQVVKDPSLLWDASTSSCLYGGPPLVEINNASQDLAPLVSEWLDNSRTVGSMLVACGAMKTSDRLRQIFTTAPQALAVACYDVPKAAVAARVVNKLQALRIKLDGSAARTLSQSLPANLQDTDFYVGKLAYYASDKGSLSTADVARCLAENKPLVRLQEIADACAAGDRNLLVRLIVDKQKLKEPAMGMINWVTRHFKLLFQLKLKAQNEPELRQLLRTYKPPIHFSQHPQLLTHWRRWTLAQLSTALSSLLEAEIEIKSTHPFGAENVTYRLIKVSALAD